MINDVAYNIIRAFLAISFLGVVVFFTVFSLFLNYHWTRFEMTAARAIKVRKLFFTVSTVLILAMAVTGLVYIF